MQAASGSVEKRCRRERDVEECEEVYRGVEKDETYLAYKYHAPGSWYAYVIVLTSDRHLLLYRMRDDLLKPKERIKHVVINEEGAELLRKKMMAVKTIEDFWSLFEELKGEIGYCDGLKTIGDLWKRFEELKKGIGSEKKGGICVEFDYILVHPYDIFDEYLLRY